MSAITALGSRLRAAAPGGRRRAVPAAFVAFFLLFGAWAFAAPYGGPADEVAHSIRAAGVVSGQVAPKPVVIDNWDGNGRAGMGALQRVPEGLWAPASCWGLDPTIPAGCSPQISGGPVRPVPTSAGRYNPVYYALVGLPLRLWPGWAGLVMARLISAALSAALLAWAFGALVRWSRRGLMPGALIVCVSPMLAHLAGAVNPNGLEISAGIALFCAGLPLFLDPEPVEGDRRQLVWLAGISAVLLALLRSMGPLWLAGALAALLIPQSRAHVARLWPSRLIRGWTLAIGAALAASAAWIVLMKTSAVVNPGVPQWHYGVGKAALAYIDNWEIYLEGLVGVAGWFDVFMPTPCYWAWISAAATLLVLGLIGGGWRERWRLMVIVAGGVVLPGIVQISQVNVVGFITAGRYMMPLLVGLPLLGAWIAERQVLSTPQCRSLTRLLGVVLVPMHLILLVYAMVRWQRGHQPQPPLGWLNPLEGAWHPPTGSVLPVAVMVLGVLATVTVFWRAWRPPSD